MKYQIIGDSDNPLVEISLGTNEEVKIENGAMVYMQDVEIEGKTNSSSKGLGGLLKSVGRSLVSGESMFITVARGTAPGGRIAIAPAVTGKVRVLSIGANQYRLNTGAFLACDKSAEYKMVSQKSVGRALFGGTGGFFIMETSGQGDLLVNAFGDLVELDVTADKPLIIDNEHVVAWDCALDYNIRIASGTFGFKSGEGLVNEFHGNGKVLIQTRNAHSLASALSEYLPKSSN